MTKSFKSPSSNGEHVKRKHSPRSHRQDTHHARTSSQKAENKILEEIKQLTNLPPSTRQELKKRWKLSPETKLVAKHIAYVVRDAMEDFHCKYLSDEQMKELNPIIRNAIARALFAQEHCQQQRWAKEYVSFHLTAIPPYGEEPELDEELLAYIHYWENQARAES